MAFFALFSIPVFTSLLVYITWHRSITWREFALQIVLQAAVAGFSTLAIYTTNTHDVEIWNGKVTEKYRDRVSCRHDYDCFCHTSCSGSGKDRSCHRVCKTCYEHSFDYNWVVKNSNGERFYIDTVDRQGVKEPPRFTVVKIDEPTSTEHGFTNYIKAAPDTLFRKTGLTEKYAKILPGYPKVYDYYRANKVITINFNLPDKEKWEERLALINADLGAKKQVNILFVFVSNLSPEFGEALSQHWLGGKKNDAIIIAGINGDKIDWAHILAWVKDDYFKVSMRDNIIGSFDIDRIMTVTHDQVIKHFDRKPMKDFEYLKSSITPTTTQWAVSMVVGLIISIAFSIFAIKEDII